ncbi:MAG: glycoside hydrolase family 20 zincin-like fold domain-containing protein, partial [Actinobacteria bacterium]|nr:glycoside hydrolase family 20 zincin-like fold domain-containing protein [Actinomycetota bacterium]
MYKILPQPKVINNNENNKYFFKTLKIKFAKCEEILIEKIKEIIKIKLGVFESLNLNFDLNKNVDEDLEININYGLDNYLQFVGKEYENLFKLQGYVIDVKGKTVNIYFDDYRGVVYSISTLKQLICKKIDQSNYYITELFILDFPEIEKRSLSVTFAWYAGYGRVGFDMQLWGFEQWKEFLELSSDYKITQLNLCMYGYWPFEFKDFPETVFRDFKMKVWNRESKNWLEIKYTHPNLINEFLSRLIKYAHLLGIDIYTYIGLNSYNGGYSNVHKDKRMKLPPNSKFINDFDTLCLSNDSTIEYLKKCMRRIVKLGVSFFYLEESEESFWFCNCDKCKDRFINTSPSLAEAKHKANYWLLNILHKEIKDENPYCNIGLRAWREPPLEKDIEYLKKCEESIPKDVCLYWAPGLYVKENEFKKWVEVFGKDRICARDTEANAISSCNGRLIRIFKGNILRPDDETNQQHINKDLEQHKGSVALKVKGINGYVFEFYGIFIHLFLHSNFGWGSTLEEEEFYDYAMESVFGPNLKDDILYVLKNLFTIHESQISLFTSEFPFMRNKVNRDDVPRINKAQEQWQSIEDKILKIKNIIKYDRKLNIYYKHFEKIENSHRRSKEIYELCLNAIEYDNAKMLEEKIKFLKLIDYYNERDFDIAKELFFDIGIIDASGIRDSMFPYHELKRVINNILNPDCKDERQIHLGVEA